MTTSPLSLAGRHILPPSRQSNPDESYGTAQSKKEKKSENRKQPDDQQGHWTVKRRKPLPSLDTLRGRPIQRRRARKMKTNKNSIQSEQEREREREKTMATKQQREREALQVPVKQLAARASALKGSIAQASPQSDVVIGSRSFFFSLPFEIWISFSTTTTPLSRLPFDSVSNVFQNRPDFKFETVMMVVSCSSQANSLLARNGHNLQNEPGQKIKEKKREREKICCDRYGRRISYQRGRLPTG